MLPTGRILLLVTVPSLAAFRAYLRSDTRLWLRWAEPEETGLDEPRLELAVATSGDRETARVVVRGPVSSTPEVRALYGCVELQAVADLLVYESATVRDPSPPYIHTLVSIDLTRQLESYGLRAEGAPAHYA